MAVDRLIGAREAGSRLGVQSRTVLKWCREGKLAHYKIMDKRVVIPEREIQRILTQGYVPAAEGARAS